MSPSPLLFDDFELRPDSGELFKDGALVKLQPQPARVLAILASRPGEVVERDEIRQLVWGDSFLDFDANLNFCIKQIRQALGDSATAPRFIETLPRRGYRFLMPVSQEPPPATVTPPPAAKAKPWLAITSVALLAGILFVLVASRHALPVIPRLVVLPFECRKGDGEVCGGMTEAITGELAKRFQEDLQVIAPDSARVYAGKSGPEIAHGLNVTHVLSGEVEISGRQIKMTARLAPAAQGKALWKESFETDLGDVPLLYAQIVRDVARGLHLPPPPVAAATGPSRPKPPSEAYEAYLQGRHLLSQDPVAAAASLQNAVLLDPNFAEAYARLAQALDGVEKPLCPDMASIETAARRALALDPDLAEAHSALAHVLFHCHLDWAQAGREYQKAIALNPGDAQTYHQYALYLTSLGRHDEAIAAVRKARDLDPASMTVGSDFVYILYAGRHYDEAIRQARRSLELISISPEEPAVTKFYHLWTLWSFFHSALKTRDEATAVAAGKALMEFHGEHQQAAGIRSLRDFLTWHEAWLQQGARTRLPGTAYFLATASVESGHYDQALRALEEDCRTRRSFMLLFVGVEPGLDPLRGDPRFERILDCVRLPADAPARTGRAVASRGE